MDPDTKELRDGFLGCVLMLLLLAIFFPGVCLFGVNVAVDLTKSVTAPLARNFDGTITDVRGYHGKLLYNEYPCGEDKRMACGDNGSLRTVLTVQSDFLEIEYLVTINGTWRSDIKVGDRWKNDQ